MVAVTQDTSASVKGQVFGHSLIFHHIIQFPFALRVLPAYLRENWTSPDFEPYKAVFPEHAHLSPEALETYVRELSEKDAKAPCLKGLQGKNSTHPSKIPIRYLVNYIPSLLLDALTPCENASLHPLLYPTDRRLHMLLLASCGVQIQHIISLPHTKYGSN